VSVIWHDLECGAYAEDLPLWRDLAERYGNPVLELGAGTGRVTLPLARHGARVTALELDRELLEALQARAEGLQVDAVHADARDFELGRRFALCIVPMQTVQLLGGPEGRRQCLRCVRRHLRPGGVAAFAISAQLEPYELSVGAPTAPLPDIAEIDGVVYSSQPTAVREQRDGFVLVRRRERVGGAGERTSSEDRIRLDRLTPEQLEDEAEAEGLQPAGRAEIARTREYVGSQVVLLGG